METDEILTDVALLNTFPVASQRKLNADLRRNPIENRASSGLSGQKSVPE